MASAYAPERAAAAGDVLSVAPMMGWTDRHFRFLFRLLSARARLYTEMFVANTLLHAPAARAMLRFSRAESPVACQLGGSEPAALAAAARMAEAAGYDEVNLNCGCPSPRVAGKGAFGARLMFAPALVRECVAAMRAAVRIPVTVKCRLGADEMDSYDEFAAFVRAVAAGGVDHFIVHARSCRLSGLDPKENRTIPPLRYAWVQRLALEEPALRISINGGLVDPAQVEQLLALARVGPEVRAAGGGGGAPVAPPAPPEPRGDGAGADARADADAGDGGDGEALCGGADDACGACDGAAAGEGGAAPEAPAGEAGAPAARAAAAGGAAAAAEAPPARRAHDASVGLLRGDSFFAGVRAGGAPFGGRGAVLDSVMVGRAAYNDPWAWADADVRFFGAAANPAPSRRAVIARYLDYADALAASLADDERDLLLYRPFEFAKPLLALFAGERGGARFRKALAQGIQERGLPLRAAVAAALPALDDETLDAPPGARRAREG